MNSRITIPPIYSKRFIISILKLMITDSLNFYELRKREDYIGMYPIPGSQFFLDTQVLLASGYGFLGFKQ